MIGPMLTTLHGSLLDAVRMGFLQSSRPHGRIPPTLQRAAEARFVGHDGDGPDATLLHFEVPRFVDVAGPLFRQKRLWDDGPQPEETAFELFGGALRDVALVREDSVRYDPGLLKRIRSYQQLLRKGVGRIEMPDTLEPRRGHIDATVVATARDLISVTPAPRRVRVAGRLDLLGVSQALLRVEVRPGEVVTARWEGTEGIETFRDLLNRDVALEGTGVFRPSGLLLRIDADALARAGADADFFRTVPSGPRRADYRKSARLKVVERSPYARLLGSIPSEESDEAFEAALDALR
jgi:hypothetical protein